MNPVVPYDDRASTLPVVFLALYLHNPTDALHEVSTVFNWENLCGCSRSDFPERRGPIRPVVVKDERPKLKVSEASNEQKEEPPRVAGLEFGFCKDFRTNHEGHYCLVAKQQQDVLVSVMGWNERDPRELEFFWNEFHDDGRFKNKISRSETSHSGAVCCTFDLPPQKGRSIVYVLTWYCPRFEVDGLDQGNGYVNAYPDSVAVAGQALAFYRYYFKAVEDWQTRIMRSSLPRWLSRLIINGNYVLSTNSIITKDNEFTMMETPENPVTGRLDRRFYGSIGTQLFFPNLDDTELGLFSRYKDEAAPGRLYRQLGVGCLHRPSHGEAADPLVDVNIKFVLMAYRNFVTTGKRFVVDHIYPRVREAMDYVAAQDRDKDGLPEHTGCSTTFGAWPMYGVTSYTGSLWIAAVRAYARLAKKLGHNDEAARYEELLPRALESFETKLWNDTGGYYRLYYDDQAPEVQARPHDACHAAQLAGQWYADFLCLGTLFPPDHIKRALAALCQLNDRRHGVVEALMPDKRPCINNETGASIPEAARCWPNFDAAHFACLLIRHGYPDRGMYIVQKMHRNIHGKRGRTFCQPLTWDLVENDACGWGTDRHMASPAAWHLLFAIEGFHLNVPDGALWLRPNLPRGVYALSAPLFTPLCIGWVKYREDDQPVYRQVIHLSFDSPIKLKTFVLRVPAEVEDVQVQCESTEKLEETNHVFGYDGKERLIEIIAREPVMVGNLLKLTVTQTHGRKYCFPVREDG
jgi:non-lysosomal glucosylceramidase